MLKVIRMYGQGKTISPTVSYFERWRRALPPLHALHTLQWAQDAVVSALSAE